jgi:DNA gyrase subunit A
MAEGETIIPINIEEEMKTAYIDYSMSVIVSRAIPDVRDGLKPVHRRVLFGMYDLGLTNGKPYKKSARIVGEVLGKYHPHGDTSVYDAMVRMAQPWSLRYPLVEGQGNFGSMDNDPPAAMRYTEARFQKIAEEMLSDIDKETVDFANNFDDTVKEPTVLPSRIPNLLVNGSSGIAVGMATNMLPHNLSEVIDGTIAYIDNNDITTEELVQFVKGPDFPTGGTIFGYDGVRQALETGRGRVVVRAKAEIVETNNKEQIIVSEIPYQVNKAELIKKIADLVNNKEIEGVSDVRDESDRDGLRIVVDVKRDGVSNVILNQLYQYTPLQTSYGVNNIALVAGRPKLLGVKDLIKYFVEFRHEVVTRRTQYELRKAEERAHILQGLLIALDHLDAVIALIRSSQTPDVAREGLMSNFGLSEIQAKAILDLRLQRLTGLERDKIKEEYEEIMKLIARLQEILDKVELRMQIIKDELLEIKKKYGDERRTNIVFAGNELNIEDLIPNEEMVITISHLGYLKRTAADEFRVQNRGGRGSKGGATRDEDFIEHMFSASSHNYLLFFTQLGKCYWLKAYEVPEGTKTSKGRAIQNVLNLPAEDKVKAFINVPNLKDDEILDNTFVILCTKKGIIKKTTLRDYSRPRANGINAVTVRDGDELLEAKLTSGNDFIMMALKSGNAIRFPEEKVRPMGRTASGVRGVYVEDNDEVIGMICLGKEDKEHSILVVSEKGYGKRSEPEEYRITNRGGKGVRTLNVTDKTGSLISILDVEEDEDLMIINKSGITIRVSVADLRIQGRATQGVRLIKIDEDDEIAAITKVAKMKEEELTDENSEGNIETEGTEGDATATDVTPEVTE